MKALILDRPGRPNTLKMGEMPMPEPGTHDVRIQVKAVGLNPVDFKLAETGWPSWTWPHVLGLDVAGTVDAVGTELPEWRLGDRVFYHGDLSKLGGYAEYAVAPGHILSRIPEHVTFESAAAIPCAGFTAWQILSRKIPVNAGQIILVHGGAGGVGGFAIQLARIKGLTILTTCSDENFPHVKELGADYPIDYAREDVSMRVHAVTDGRGVDIVINTIDRESATQDLQRLAFGDHLACVAGLPDFSKMEPFTKALSFHESALGGAHLSGDRLAQLDLAKMGNELVAMVRDGKLSPMVTDIIPWADTPKALTRLSERHVKGKIVANLDT